MVEPIAATSTSWAYEVRRDYLIRKLKFAPWLASVLVSDGLWTGTYDPDGNPIPSEQAFQSGLWQREVFPVYNGPEPELNKMRSLRDTLILRPDAGPHLIAAGLWAGEYDAQGLPIPTPAPIENRRRR